MSKPIPVIKYSFDSCTPGSTCTTVTNEGSIYGYGWYVCKSEFREV